MHRRNEESQNDKMSVQLINTSKLKQLYSITCKQNGIERINTLRNIMQSTISHQLMVLTQKRYKT